MIKALTFLERQIGSDLSEYSKQIAVITYTNAACDEILRRMQYKSIFAVSTIHSFLWELIKNYQTDIKEWVKADILSEIEDLDKKQSSGRIGTAAYTERAEKIVKNKERLGKLERIKRFSYNPNGENFGYDSLNHAEVIKMGSEFIACKDTMQKILISKYPILLIDESQDTKKELIDALQQARSDAEVGTIRLFIAGTSADKADIEKKVAEIMAKEANDDKWLIPDERKSLILEHHMAASRLGFIDLHAPLDKIKSFDTSLRDGTLPELSFLANIVLPLVKAYQDKRDFEVSKIVRQYSPLLDKKSFADKKENQSELIQTAEKAVDNLLSLWNEKSIPSCIDILNSIKKSGLFKISERLDDILTNPEQEALMMK